MIFPTIIATSTQSQDFTHLFNWKHPMMFFDKFISFQSFLEKMTTAFFNMSRSSFKSRFSIRNLRNTSFSASCNVDTTPDPENTSPSFS